MGMHAEVALVIVNYNSGAHLQRCLRAVARMSTQPGRVIVVDNASSDNSLKALADFPQVELVKLSENEGFAKANNRAARLAGNATWLAFLNPDAFPAPDWLEQLLQAAVRHPQVACFASTMLRDGTTDCLDGLGDTYHVSGLAWRRGCGSPLRPARNQIAQNQIAQNQIAQNQIAQNQIAQNQIAQNQIAQNQIAQNQIASSQIALNQKAPSQPLQSPQLPSAEEEVFSACAAAALYRTQAFTAMGGFDESYFCYFEDVDLGFRLRLAGYRTLLVPAAVAVHVGSAASGRHSAFTIYHAHRNLVWTYWKDMPFWLLWKYLPQHLFQNIISLIWFTLRGQGRAIFKAKWDALLGLRKVLRTRAQIHGATALNSRSVSKFMTRGWFTPYWHFGRGQRLFQPREQAIR